MISVALKWSRRNLFGKPVDALLSAVVIPLVLWLIYLSGHWIFAIAQWGIVPQSLRILMIGIYPAEEMWRAWIAVIIIGALLGGALGCVFRFKSHHAALMAAILIPLLYLTGGETILTLAFSVATIAAFTGGWMMTSLYLPFRRVLVPASLIGLVAIFLVLAPPGVGLWGGLLLSVLITLVTSILTLPLGILLAFGRRSKISSVRVICTAYIEVMRSVPLILVVYWVWILMPVLAPQWGVADVARGMIGFTVFYSAYVAEYVRSGLKAVPSGQGEAARSLGMSEIDINRYIVLPQALRVVVPPLVGNVLDIFNTAPLVFIIGLTDFLRAGQMILANPQNGERTYEIYTSLLLTYFLIGPLITFVARKLEAHLAKGSS